MRVKRISRNGIGAVLIGFVLLSFASCSLEDGQEEYEFLNLRSSILGWTLDGRQCFRVDEYVDNSLDWYEVQTSECHEIPRPPISDDNTIVIVRGELELVVTDN